MRAPIAAATSSGTGQAPITTRSGRAGQTGSITTPETRPTSSKINNVPENNHTNSRGGSGLNIAEIELSCLTKQCLGRRIAELDVLNAELTAWTTATNADERQVNWQFTTSDARIKLRHLYPVF